MTIIKTLLIISFTTLLVLQAKFLFAEDKIIHSYITLRPFIPEAWAFYKARNRAKNEHEFKCVDAARLYTRALLKAGYEAKTQLVYDKREISYKKKTPELHALVKCEKAWFDPANDRVYGWKLPRYWVLVPDPPPAPAPLKPVKKQEAREAEPKAGTFRPSKSTKPSR